VSTTDASAPAFTRAGPGWRYRVESLPVRRLQDFALAAIVVAVGAVAHAVSSASAPLRERSEVELLTRAWASDWHGHPPLGLVGLHAWTSRTGAFDRAPTTVGAGRELMLVAYVAAAGLLWVLGRRLDLTRWATAVALAVFGLTPVAVELHRQVSLANLAVPWLVAAFAFAVTPRRSLIAYAAGGACLALAVLTHEAALLFVPAYAVVLRRSTVPSTRRYATVISGTVCVLVCLAALIPGGVGDLGSDVDLSSLVVLALPAVALLVGRAAQRAWGPGRALAPVVAVGIVAAVGLAGWWVADRRLVAPEDVADPAAPLVIWLRDNQAEAHARLAADDGVWIDLAAADIEADRPADRRPRDILVTTAARQTGTILATFEIAGQRVDVVDLETRDAADTTDQGAALARNPALDLSAAARRDLVAGRVDARLTTTLVALGTTGEVEVTAFPADPAEVPARAPRRVVELRFSSVADARAAVGILEAQQPPYLPAAVTRDGRDVVVTYRPQPFS